MSAINTDLDPLLAASGLRYFSAGEEFILVFQGRRMDHHILVRTEGTFVQASCLLIRLLEHPSAALAEELLRWQSVHCLARLSLADDELSLVADLPLQGLKPAQVEELVLSVATAAEQLKPRLLRSALNISDDEAEDSEESSDDQATGSAPARSRDSGTPSPIPSPSLRPELEDSEIDWDAEDI